VRTAAILPVKRFAVAKQRLGPGVQAPVRRQLARAMVQDVLDALARTPALERTVVITDEPAIAAAARGQGAIAIADAARAGQSAAVALGIERALAEGFQRALCIPGDCPALDPADLHDLLSAPARRREVVIVPDRHGTGTNGLLLTPPGVIAPAFGPGSCARHRSLAIGAGASCRLEHPPSLLLDIDTGEDLAALREQLGARGAAQGDAVIGARAAHTRALLARAGGLPAAASIGG
jgi:2-phospho-L-lactate guanylyltransferase